MTWTRAVLITAALGFAVVTTSAQSNLATLSSSPQPQIRTRLRIRQPHPHKRLRALTPKPMAIMSVAIPALPVTRIRADASTEQQWEKQWHIRTLRTRLTVANRVTARVVCTSRQVAPRIRFLSALLKIPRTLWLRKISPAYNATPAETSFSGEAARTNRGPWLAWIATRLIRNCIIPCPMRRASTHRLRKTKV